MFLAATAAFKKSGLVKVEGEAVRLGGDAVTSENDGGGDGGDDDDGGCGDDDGDGDGDVDDDDDTDADNDCDELLPAPHFALCC